MKNEIISRHATAWIIPISIGIALGLLVPTWLLVVVAAILLAVVGALRTISRRL